MVFKKTIDAFISFHGKHKCMTEHLLVCRQAFNYCCSLLQDCWEAEKLALILDLGV